MATAAMREASRIAAPLADASPQPSPLSVSELVQLSRALQTLQGVADALTMRQAFYTPEGRCTPAGRRFEKIADAIGDQYLAVMDELRDSPPRTPLEVEARGGELLAFDLGCDDAPTDIALAAVRRVFPGRY